MYAAESLPEMMVFEESVPVPVDGACPSDGLYVVDEAEDVEGEFWGEFFEKVAFEKRGDGGGNEEEFVWSAVGREEGREAFTAFLGREQ